MDEPQMYLKKRKGWWIFRRPIPKAMQPFITQGCRTEFIVSLKTKDRRQLSKLYAEALRESDRVIDEAGALAKASNGRSVDATKPTGKREEALTRRPLHEFTRSELHVLVHRWYLKAKEDVLAEAHFIFGMCESDERQAELLKLDQQLRCLQRRDGEYADLETFRQAREIVEEAGGSVNWWSPAPFAETHSWFIASVREGLISLNGYARGIIENGTPPDSGHLLTPPVEASPAPPTSISLNELMKRFDSDPNREHVKKKTRDEFQLVYRMLREFVGGETAIAAITRGQIKELQDMYRQLPARFSSLYPGKELRETVKLAKQDGREPMERATFNKRMTLLSSVFRFAVREQLLSASPAEGLTMKEKKKADGDKSFTVDQLNLIFSGPLFQAFALEPTARYTPQHRLNPHEFWAPLIALFQGFRMEEILQLTPSDIDERDGVPCIHIRDGDGQSVKTDASRRIVPIHPELERLGWLKYVSAIRQVGGEELFPDAKRGHTYGNRSHNYSKRFSRYLSEVGVKEGRNQVFHSFRHTFADGLRVAGVPQDALRRLGGWTDG
ncbi:MAG: site-specific integrase, partial [Prosthecobacter sp.]|nr:site-specific integrase [Prosthecobacter sp.]